MRSQTSTRTIPSGFFVRFAPTSRRHLPRLQRARHRPRALAARQSARPARVRGGTVAIHEGLREFGDVDNGVAICEFEGGKLACFYASRTMAHGHETATESSAPRAGWRSARNPRLNRVEIADAHGVRNECTPTFYERFDEAFLREAQAFVASCGAAASGRRARWPTRPKRRASASRCGVAAERPGGYAVRLAGSGVAGRRRWRTASPA